ncbi:MAG: prepilin-type N-terminal cleavage/methylation domain-containing protein [Opitutaceae bacterium]|nr:prepilin-type N-terminal cleavage/methylation domain-containing protein [Opitutaceae bacterium]
MKTSFLRSRRSTGFTLAEVMISMTIVSMVMAMCMSTFLFGLRAMYKDTQRLATNANLRSFMAQISKETLDASYFYLFGYYTKLDGNIDLTVDPAFMTQINDAADNDYDKWVAQGDCLVLVTRTSQFRTRDIRQIRIYYRVVTAQSLIVGGVQVGRNGEVALRYYETADWGEGTSGASNGHTNLTTELNLINLNSSPTLTGSRLISSRTIGRTVPSPYTPYASGDRYPAFSSESPDGSVTNGFVSINLEFINGSTAINLLSSSSFNYTISPRR